MPRDNEPSFLRSVLRENESAVQLCQTLFSISQTLDDLIDGDTTVSGADVITAFWMAIVDLPRNAFYRKHEHELSPMLKMVLQDYVDSAALERSENERHKQVAFVLRDQLTSVVVQCALLVGGYDWMRKVSISIRDHFHEDTYADYAASLIPLSAPETPEATDDQ